MRNSEEQEIISPTVGTRKEFTLDSIYLYAKQIYLWNDALPSYAAFNPREKYRDLPSDLTVYKKELFDISNFKINPVTAQPFERNNSLSPKYSYLEYSSSKSSASKAGINTTETILAQRIIRNNTKTIAYLALGSFPNLSSAQSKLNQVFNEFAAENPKYLILDLRTNRGGYIETAEYVANLIVPSTLNGKIMYSELYNSTLQSGNAKILRYQPYLDENGKTVLYKGRAATLADVDYTESGNTYLFKKKGNLESIQEIYVITSNVTASASELLISCLKPYFDVKLIGEKTYGKPVGFFGINIDQYTVYLSSFLLKNAQGWSDYFTGMGPDVFIENPNNPALGDINEVCFNTAISLINGNIKTAENKGKLLYKKSNPMVTDKSEIFSSENSLLETRLKLKQ
ncbi:S41 family peptidase [Pedobacter sp. MW01-1-1]|uniref:S41 family peptidase n=1 Tax=Pedobacter sp. MW01-1-1 TaxID=3383027 RepID=UPI003FEFAE75